jgi:hypothetical protein
MQRMKRHSLALALIGAVALGAVEPGSAADLVLPRAPRHVTKHWRVIKRVVVRGCIEVSEYARGCPLHHYARLPWPGVPRVDVEPAYDEPGWHRCWWGEWC